MKRVFAISTLVIGLSVLLSVSTAAASLVTIDFNDLSSGDVVTTQYSADGVVFSADYNDFPWEDAYAQASDHGDGIMIGPSYCNSSAYFQADFSVLVDFVSVEIYPFETATDYVFGLYLYDASDNVVGSATDSGSFTGPYDPTQFVYLETDSLDPNVAYARFYGYYGGVYGVNSIVADNLTFGTVPEPTTVLLIVTGFIGLAGFRKKFKS